MAFYLNKRTRAYTQRRTHRTPRTMYDSMFENGKKWARRIISVIKIYTQFNVARVCEVVQSNKLKLLEHPIAHSISVGERTKQPQRNTFYGSQNKITTTYLMFTQVIYKFVIQPHTRTHCVLMLVKFRFGIPAWACQWKHTTDTHKTLTKSTYLSCVAASAAKAVPTEAFSPVLFLSA